MPKLKPVLPKHYRTIPGTSHWAFPIPECHRNTVFTGRLDKAWAFSTGDTFYTSWKLSLQQYHSSEFECLQVKSSEHRVGRGSEDDPLTVLYYRFDNGPELGIELQMTAEELRESLKYGIDEEQIGRGSIIYRKKRCGAGATKPKRKVFLKRKAT